MSFDLEHFGIKNFVGSLRAADNNAEIEHIAFNLAWIKLPRLARLGAA